MTERKPRELTFRTWVDQQISDAAERGAFDNLPGAGKPLPDRGPNADHAWLLDWMRREGVDTEELLPTPLKLRKQSARLAETIGTLRSEEQVRQAVAELNERIMEWRKLPLGPPIFVPLVDAEDMTRRWRATRPPEPAAGPPPPPERQRWWQRAARRSSR